MNDSSIQHFAPHRRYTHKTTDVEVGDTNQMIKFWPRGSTSKVTQLIYDASGRGGVAIHIYLHLGNRERERESAREEMERRFKKAGIQGEPSTAAGGSDYTVFLPDGDRAQVNRVLQILAGTQSEEGFMTRRDMQSIKEALEEVRAIPAEEMTPALAGR